MSRSKGRSVALAAGGAAILVLGAGAIVLREPIGVELSYRGLLSEDFSQRERAVERLRASGWKQCLSRLLKRDAGPSYQVFLREASLIVPPLLVDREWGEVKGFLDGQGFAVAKYGENGAAVNVQYVLKKSFLPLPKGLSLDLYLLLRASNLNGPIGPALPGKVSRANVTLVADLGRSHEEVIREGPFPDGSALSLVLDQPRVRETGLEWPILNDIQVFYAVIQDRYSEYDPSGFIVRVAFTASLTEEIAGKEWDFMIESGLDPSRSRQGKAEPGSEFRPLDKLGGVRVGGGGQWWSGDREAFEANKKKYLRKVRSF